MKEMLNTAHRPEPFTTANAIAILGIREDELIAAGGGTATPCVLVTSARAIEKIERDSPDLILTRHAIEIKLKSRALLLRCFDLY